MPQLSSPFRVPLPEFLSRYTPTDMLPPGAPESADNATLWGLVFKEIESCHEKIAPDYWKRFAESVCARQRVPVRVTGTQVINGHHRTWALARAGKPSIRLQMVSYDRRAG